MGLIVLVCKYQCQRYFSVSTTTEQFFLSCLCLCCQIWTEFMNNQVFYYWVWKCNSQLHSDGVYLLFGFKANVRGSMYNASSSINDGFEFKKTLGSVFFLQWSDKWRPRFSAIPGLGLVHVCRCLKIFFFMNNKIQLWYSY